MNEQRLKSDQNLAALKIQVVWRHLKKLRDFKESKKQMYFWQLHFIVISVHQNKKSIYESLSKYILKQGYEKVKINLLLDKLNEQLKFKRNDLVIN